MRIQLISGFVENRWKNYRRFLKPIFTKTFDTIDTPLTQRDASVILVDDIKMQEMNEQYRDINKTTDVLTFIDDEDSTYLGDVFVNVDALERQAKEYGHSLKREFCFLVTHGVLHLLGYDHQTNKEAEVMFALQEEILSEIAPRLNR
ncbi:MAG: rRNA maturation RNase YbeY [Erysipelothrix sp.]|nr:rRNA maturation RNase YbeY [Erysipelothrix sp.]